MSDSNYTATHGLMKFLYGLNNLPAEGTGIQVLIAEARNIIGEIPLIVVDYCKRKQNNVFGNYPDKSDIIPSAIFAAIFGIIMFAHLFVFLMNESRGHHFYITLAWVFNSALKSLGFIFRIIWAQDNTKTQIGLTSEVFLILSTIFLVSFDLILAQRIFTWRHPVGGSRKLFWNTMFAMYGAVGVVIAMTIVASAVPYVYLLDQAGYDKCKTIVRVSAVLIILYLLTSVALLCLAYFFQPTRKDENLYTYQPWWIESFSTFYYVEKGAAEKAAETFMKRNHNHRHATRVIAATKHHHLMVEGLSKQRGDLKHNYSLIFLTISTLLIFVGALCRLVVVFQSNTQETSSQFCSPILMYVCWGAFEGIIYLMYLVGRVDLRFYRPDRLPAKVRAIITAHQSIYVSDAESDDDDDDDEYIASDSETNVNYSGYPEKHVSDDDSEFRF